MQSGCPWWWGEEASASYDHGGLLKPPRRIINGNEMVISSSVKAVGSWDKISAKSKKFYADPTFAFESDL